MISLSDAQAVQALLRRHGFHFSKAMGQNFIVDDTVCPRMAQQCGADSKTGVLEIGPGIGVLTRELSAVAQKVVAVELDTRLLPVLKETLADCRNVTVYNGDILKIDVHALLKKEFSGMDVVVCANLPYYITSSNYHEIIGRTSAHPCADRDGAERGGRADLRRSGFPDLWSCQCGGALLCGAGNFVWGGAR